MLARSTLPLFVLTSLVLCSGCSEHDYIYGQITQHNNGYTSDSESDSDAMTLSTSTGEEDGEITDEDETTTTTGEPEPDPTSALVPLEVDLRASTDRLTAAGSIVLTAEVSGDPFFLNLFVTNGPTQKISWPKGQTSYEYIIDTPEQNGTIEFRLVAQDGVMAPAIGTADVEVDLPPSGTLAARVLGKSATVGKAVTIRRGHDGDPDTVFVIGNDLNQELLISHVDGLLWTEPMDPNHPLDVRAAAAYGEEDIIVVGQIGDAMEVRSFHQIEDKWIRTWDQKFEQASARDVKVGKNGRIYVAGAIKFVDHTDAAAWVLTGSGGLVFHDSHVSYDDLNEPLNSEFYSVVIGSLHATWVGESEVKVDNVWPMRGVLFKSYDDDDLELVAIHKLPANDFSGWRAAVATPAGLATLGWHFDDVLQVEQMTVGRYGPDLSQPFISTSPNYVGNAIAWHPANDLIVGGSKLEQGQPHLFFESDIWQPYVDSERGVVHDIAVDRHGYTHLVGEVSINGLPLTVLLTVNP